MERSMTPQTAPGIASPGYGAPAAAPAFGARSGFMSGIMGGLIGAGIGGMLFGHGMFGGFSGIGSLFGLIIQLALVFFLVRWLWRMFASRQPAMAGGPGLFNRTAAGPQPTGGGGGAPRPAQITISPADFQAFEQLLKAVQAAWSSHDLATLQRIATPEMVSYFSEQLSDQASRGVRNTVTAVNLEQGDLSQAWAEQGREYATVAMRFTMVDVTVDGAGRVVDGSPNERVAVTEIWTFVRANRGSWLLSAIQQTR